MTTINFQQQQYIKKMDSIAEDITQKAYEDIDKSLNKFIEDLEKMGDGGHQIIVALAQIQRTPTLQLHYKTLNLKYYDDEAKVLLIAYFDIIIHLQFVFGMYQLDIKYGNLDAIYKFQEFVERVPYGDISIYGTYYDIPTSFDIPEKRMHTGKGSKSINKKKIERWKEAITMAQKTREIYNLVGKITYLLDSNIKYGDIIIASDSSTVSAASDSSTVSAASAASTASIASASSSSSAIINSSLSILDNLKLILRKLKSENKNEILSLIPINKLIPKECTRIAKMF